MRQLQDFAHARISPFLVRDLKRYNQHFMEAQITK